jgi:hypothetical protein
LLNELETVSKRIERVEALVARELRVIDDLDTGALEAVA